ncbi:MAG: putative acyltransferase [Blastococcus sp.]|nr:putative acyltransferase [Blastococcus sp.]
MSGRAAGVARPARAGRVGGSRGDAFRPDIEGLRAVAVLAVVMFHAGVPGVPGGFVGVDVFFVISGFLITGMLAREVGTTGTVRLGRFYAARARRLLPAGVLVIVATATAAAALLPPLQARAVLGDGVASALYVANYRFAAQGTDYLAADAPPSPFQHYWSLGVEEQFYLLWPAVLIATAWFAARCRRGGADTAAWRLRAAVLVLAVIAAISFAGSLRWTDVSPPWAFFSLPSRAWQLAAGGLAALGATWWRRLPPLVAGPLGWAGLGLIVAGCLRLDDGTAYPGLAALLPVGGAVLVVGTGCAHPVRGVGSVLALPPMQWIGRISYSWYLWHWPVLLLAPALLGHPLGPASRLLASALAAALAVGTVQAVENPVRYGPLRKAPGRSLALAGALTALGVCASLAALSAVPAPVGKGASTRTPEIGAGQAPAVPSAAGRTPEEAAVQRLTAQVQAAVAASVDVRAVPADLMPPLAKAPVDKPEVFVNGCVRSWLGVGQKECASGDTASALRVVLVGDSHAAMWTPPMEQVAAERHWRLETMAKVLCPMLDLPTFSPYLGRNYAECTRWRGQILDRLRAEHPAVVVLDMARRYTPDYGFAVYGGAWLDSLSRMVSELRSTGARVLVLGPVPDPRSVVPTCLSEHLDSAVDCAPDRAVAVDDAGIAAEERATVSVGGSYANLVPLFCTASRCPVIVGDLLVYRDDNHVTIDYARWLAPVLEADLDRVLATP